MASSGRMTGNDSATAYQAHETGASRMEKWDSPGSSLGTATAFAGVSVKVIVVIFDIVYYRLTTQFLITSLAKSLSLNIRLALVSTTPPACGSRTRSGLIS